MLYFMCKDATGLPRHIEQNITVSLGMWGIPIDGPCGGCSDTKSRKKRQVSKNYCAHRGFFIFELFNSRQ